MENNFQVQEKYENYKEKLRNRLSQFSIDVIKLLMQIPFKRELDVLKTQLSRSATAIGANFVEAQATSYKEFIQQM